MVETKISTLVFSLMFFSAIILGLSIFSVDLASNYGKDAEDLSGMNITRDIIDSAKEARDALSENPFTNIPIIGGIIDFFYQGLIAVWSSMNIMIGSVGLMTTLITESGDILYLPGWFTLILTGIITLVIVMALAAIITKREV